MKILFVNPALLNSGAPKMLAWAANALSTFPDFEVSILTYFDLPVKQAISKTVNHHCLNLSRKSWFYNNTIGILHTIRGIRKHIQKNRPDLAISYGDMFSSLMLCQKKLPTKIVVFERGDPTCAYTRWEIFRRKILYPRADAMLFQTTEARQWYPLEIQKRSAVIPNPVTLERKPRCAAADRNNVIAFVGRFERVVKRQDIMLSAFRILLDRYPEHANMKLVFYGWGNPAEVQWLKDKIVELALTGYVEMPGSVSAIQSYLWPARMFVMTSDHEGIPNALIEAMALGLPVVTTDCSPGGARLLVKNGENGLLVPRGNVEAIAEAMHDLLAHTDKADRLGTKAQEITETFSPAKIRSMWREYMLSMEAMLSNGKR